MDSPCSGWIDQVFGRDYQAGAARMGEIITSSFSMRVLMCCLSMALVTLGMIYISSMIIAGIGATLAKLWSHRHGIGGVMTRIVGAMTISAMLYTVGYIAFVGPPY
jgi:hypothetical protein